MRWGEFNEWNASERLCRSDRSFDLAREILKEMLGRFSKDEAQTVLRQISPRALVHHTSRVIADGAGRLADPPRGLFPHRRTSVQNAIDRRHADLGCAREISNCGTPSHGSTITGGHQEHTTGSQKFNKSINLHCCRPRTRLRDSAPRRVLFGIFNASDMGLHRPRKTVWLRPWRSR